MDQTKFEKLHRIYGWITVFSLVLTAILLICSIIGIYQSGEHAFTRESIAAAFRSIALPCYLCLATLVGGGLLHILLPVSDSKTKPIRDEAQLLQRYFSSDFTNDQILSLQKKRKIMAIAFWSATSLLSLYPICYLLNSANFGVSDITADVAKATIVVAIPACLVFVGAIICSHFDHILVQKLIAIFKENGIKPTKVENDEKKTSLLPIRLIVAALAVAFIILGIVNEGYVDVLGKAIKICTECIGLG